jgi:hypothetical protein
MTFNEPLGRKPWARRELIFIGCVLLAWAIAVGCNADGQEKPTTVPLQSPHLIDLASLGKVETSAQSKSSVLLDDPSADKFMLAVEKKSHADDLVQAAFTIWKQQPTVAQLYADDEAKGKAMNDLAGELI